MTKRQLNRAISSLVGIIVLLLASLVAQKLQPEPTAQLLGSVQAGFYSVRTVHDGDTISVTMNGQEEKVRMIGVDTPETQDPRKAVQCFGKAASQFTKDLIANNPVRLEADPTNTNRDRYGRLLRYVYLPDGRLVNAEIIKQGYGFAYVAFPVQKLEEFRALEQEARQANRGLWGSCQLVPNQYGGFNTNDQP